MVDLGRPPEIQKGCHQRWTEGGKGRIAPEGMTPAVGGVCWSSKFILKRLKSGSLRRLESRGARRQPRKPRA
jgi:hypothetical protein